MVHSVDMIEELAATNTIAERVEAVRERIARATSRAGRGPDSVTLIAVTKTMSAATVRAATQAGVHDVGENKVREAVLKVAALEDQQVHWHLIGHLQSNKVARAVETFSTIQSLDSLTLASLVSSHAVRDSRTIDAFAQVNVSGEASKSGFAPDELRRAAASLAALPALRWRGLMTIAPEQADSSALHTVFSNTRHLFEELAGSFAGTSWNALSMGMTNDFELAIEEGATHVRVGRAIFGDRAQPARHVEAVG